MIRPKLVFLAPRHPWPLDRGDRIRAYHLLRQLSRHADITLLSLTEGPAAAAPLAPFDGLCQRVEVISLTPLDARLNLARGLLSPSPLQVSWFRSEAMERLVDRIALTRPEFVVGHLIRSFPWVERFRGGRTILELTDAISLTLRRATAAQPFWRRPLVAEELRRTKRYERRVLERTDEAWVVSEVDRTELLRLSPQARVTALPNGVDPRLKGLGLNSDGKEDMVLFLGNLTVQHNIDAVRFLVDDIWPLVRHGCPGAALVVVGPGGAAVSRFARGAPGVQLTGFVADLTPLLRRARVAVAPLRFGAGIQNKVLECLAAGLPVVVTPQVAAPIGAEASREILVGADAPALAEALLRQLADPGAAARIGAAGSRFVFDRFNWDRIGDEFQEVVRKQGR